MDETKTYKVDWENGRISGGFISGSEAVAQCLDKELRTRRYCFPIYDSQYGAEFWDVIAAGGPPGWAEARCIAIIEDILNADERIIGHSEIKAERKNNHVIFTGTVQTEFGDLELEAGVNV